MTLLKMIT